MIPKDDRGSAGGCSCTSSFIASRAASGGGDGPDRRPRREQPSRFAGGPLLDAARVAGPGAGAWRLWCGAHVRHCGRAGVSCRAAPTFPGAAAREHIVDINEGIAMYTQFVLGSEGAQDAIRNAVVGLAGAESGTSFVRTFAYASGAGYGLLLDALSPGWHRKITAASDVGQLLSAAAGVTAAPDAVAAAARYDGAQVRAAEEQRDREQQAVIAELRRRYVDGPVLIVPRAGRGSSNNMGATVIPGAGTVFRAMANKGAWGFFDAQGGALVSADEETISLPAPVVVDATTLKGDGWTATVGPGWTVQPGPRPGSFRVVRQ